LVYGEQTEAVESLLKIPEVSTLTTEFRASAGTAVKVLFRLQQMDDNTGRDCVALLTEAPLDHLRLLTLRKTLLRLVDAGRGDEADRVIGSLDGMKIDAKSLNQTSAAIRLQLTREIREAKLHHPFLSVFRETILALPQATNLKPSKFIRAQTESRITGHLTAKQRFAMLTHLLRSGRASHDMKWSLILLLGPAHIADHGDRLSYGPKLLERLLSLQENDTVKSEWVILVASLCDVDLPEIKTATETLLKTFIASPAAKTQPRTKDAAIAALTFKELRTSFDARPPAVFTLLDQTQMPTPGRSAIKLSYHFTRGESREAMDILDNMDAEGFVDMPAFGIARNLLRQEGRDSEQKLLEETARAKIAERMTILWFSPANMDLARQTLGLACAAEAGDLVPDAWFERALAVAAEEYEKIELRVFRARLRGDWSGLWKASGEAIKHLPDVYEPYYLRALAAHHMGRSDVKSIVSDLGVYLKYARSDFHYPEAVALLGKLTEPKP
jgi:hypothetical protein